MTATERYIHVLTCLKPGDLGLLRTHTTRGLDETVDGFDLFAGLWWPLRKKSKRAPRREVAWLIAKLFAFRPVEHSPGDHLAQELGRLRPNGEKERARYTEKFDRMLVLPVNKIEPALQWAIDWVASNNLPVDWVKLTDDLSHWERESTRLKWAEEFLGDNERGQSC